MDHEKSLGLELFNVKAFQALMTEKIKATGMSRETLSRKANGDVSAQALNQYKQDPNRYPKKVQRWLPLMKLFGISKEDVLRIDKRPSTPNWLRSLDLSSLEPYTNEEGWKSTPLQKGDLQFLLQVSEGLAQPLTFGLALELISRRKS